MRGRPVETHRAVSREISLSLSGKILHLGLDSSGKDVLDILHFAERDSIGDPGTPLGPQVRDWRPPVVLSMGMAFPHAELRA